jgi:Protein of unknown function (DUF3810)
MYQKKWWWIGLLSTAITIKIAAFFPAFIETYYSNGLYLLISRFQRLLLGWLPFSAGDILYAILFLYLLRVILKTIKSIAKKRTTKEYWLKALKKTGFAIIFIYVAFNLLWGLNYNRLGHGYQLQLTQAPYSTEDLEQLTRLMIIRLSTFSVAAATPPNYWTKKNLFKEASNSYKLAAKQYPQLDYPVTAVKPSLFSYLGNYLGYTGYYNPFTGEAQVNTTVPQFVQPFTTCHEIGHQLGYAKENEANFAGYLTAKKSTDTAFLYSLYFDLYSYAIRELYSRDSVMARTIHTSIPAKAKADFKALQLFYEKHQNPIEPVIKYLYTNYLRANEQPSGMQSYSEVTALLIAYYKKNGAATF